MMMGYTTTAMDTMTRPDDATMWYDTNGRGYDPAKEGMTQRRRVRRNDGVFDPTKEGLT